MDAGKFIDETYKRDWAFFAAMCCGDLECKNCGYKVPVAIDFHSIDLDVEEFGFAALWEQNPASTDLNKIYRVMKQSKQLCANCHVEEHIKLGIELYKFFED